MNRVFLALVLCPILVAAHAQWMGDAPAMETLSAAMVDAAAAALPLAMGLVGIMALFLGLMKVAEESGLLSTLARLLEAPLARLFPSVPAGHPAMGAMVMNVAANLLGLGNAATPFGIKAMEQLETLNPRKGVASNAQVLFLGINTAGLTLLPTKVIALRAASGAADPAAVMGPTLAAGLVALVAAILSAKLLEKLWQPESAAPSKQALPSAPLWPGLAILVALPVLAALLLSHGKAAGPWILPLMAGGLLLWGAVRRVAVYECFVDGAKEGFAVAVRIIPYLVAILVAIAMVRASGLLDMILAPMGRWLGPFGLPVEALLMAVMRTLSGSGSYGLLAASMKDAAIGPDGYLGILLGTLYGSTETTFYVLAVYFGAVQIKRIRHALVVGLLADLAALIAAVVICRMVYG